MNPEQIIRGVVARYHRKFQEARTQADRIIAAENLARSMDTYAMAVRMTAERAEAAAA